MLPLSYDSEGTMAQVLQLTRLSPFPSNRLLAALAPEDLARLRPHIQLVALVLGEVPGKPGRPVAHVLFPKRASSPRSPCLGPFPAVVSPTAISAGTVAGWISQGALSAELPITAEDGGRWTAGFANSCRSAHAWNCPKQAFRAILDASASQ